MYARTFFVVGGNKLYENFEFVVGVKSLTISYCQIQKNGNKNVLHNKCLTFINVNNTHFT